MKANQNARTFSKDERAAVGDLGIAGILVGIGLLLFLTMVTPIADQTAAAKSSANTTSSHDALLDILPLVFIAGGVVSIAGGAFFAVRALKK